MLITMAKQTNSFLKIIETRSPVCLTGLLCANESVQAWK
jgi:hypothetical protein